MGLYGERKYLLPELAQYQLAVATPLGPGIWGLDGLMSGSLLFRETKMGLSYARGLGKKIDAGLSFGYHAISIGEGYGSSGTITAAAGVRMHLNDRLHLGVSVFNPAGGKFGKWKEEQLSPCYRFGCGFEAADRFYLEGQIEKEPDQPVNVILGWQYQPHPAIRIRAGIASVTGSGWIGAGYTFRQWRIDIGATVHPQLGLSPGLLFLYRKAVKKADDPKTGI